ncbi:MAG: hypothetical protein ACM37W_14430, partial [Actinomycetota bacterium]
MSQMPTKEDLLKTLAQINKTQKGEVFSAPMLAKILGAPKKWRALSKSELCQVLEAWKEMRSAYPHTANWLSLVISNRMVSLTADGVRWVDYFGFPSQKAAEEFLEKIVPHCQWAMCRQSGKRVNASFECKVWRLEEQQFQAIVNQEQALLT